MSDKPKTAVQWYIDERDKLSAEFFDSAMTLKELHERVDQLQAKAIAMEREQHKFNFECGRNYQLTGEGTFEETHTETYGE
jgi:hypothetical protein